MWSLVTVMRNCGIQLFYEGSVYRAGTGSQTKRLKSRQHHVTLRSYYRYSRISIDTLVTLYVGCLVML